MKNNVYFEDDEIIIAQNDDRIEILSNQMAEKFRPEIIAKYRDRSTDIFDQKYVTELNQNLIGGYVINMPNNIKNKTPIKTCFHLNQDGFSQYVRNLVVVGENADLNLEIYCQASDCATNSKHFSLTEYYVESGSKLKITMIHNWNQSNQVFPLTMIEAGDNSEIELNYLCIDSPAKIISEPKVLLKGKNAKLITNTIVFSHQNSNCEIGDKAYLLGERSQAKVVSKVVSNGGKIINRASIVAEASSAKGHTQCDGLILDNLGLVEAIPVLKNINSQAELSHEASISKINPAAVEYLATRGIKEEDATKALVIGFTKIDSINTKIKQQFEDRINQIFDKKDLSTM